MNLKKEKIKLVVNGEKVRVPLKPLIVNDIDKAMRRIGSEIAYWGRILASAEREKNIAEAYYRQWRAKRGKEICSDNKLSEWKVIQELNSEPMFIKLKQAIANAEFNFSVLLRYYEALNKQAFILPSIGARKRAEEKSIGMTTKE